MIHLNEDKLDDELFEATGRVTDPRALVVLLYRLMRDLVPSGKLVHYARMGEARKPPYKLPDGDLGRLAIRLADELTGDKTVFETEPDDDDEDDEEEPPVDPDLVNVAKYLMDRRKWSFLVFEDEAVSDHGEPVHAWDVPLNVAGPLWIRLNSFTWSSVERYLQENLCKHFELRYHGDLYRVVLERASSFQRVAWHYFFRISLVPENTSKDAKEAPTPEEKRDDIPVVDKPADTPRRVDTSGLLAEEDAKFLAAMRSRLGRVDALLARVDLKLCIAPDDEFLQGVEKELQRLESLLRLLTPLYTQQGDDHCWRDLYTKEAATLAGFPNWVPKVLDKPTMLANCGHFVDCLLSHDHYVTPTVSRKEHEKEVRRLQDMVVDARVDLTYRYEPSNGSFSNPAWYARPDNSPTRCETYDEARALVRKALGFDPQT
jgi:hypothetical protein